jgi:hypothetical protein
LVRRLQRYCVDIHSVIMVFACYLLIHNREALAGASGVPFITYFPVAVLVIFLAGAAIAAYLKRRDQPR